MDDYGVEKARRVAQFEDWLRSAYERSRRGERDWFVIFSERAGGGSDDGELEERRKIGAPRVAVVGDGGARFEGEPAGEASEFDLPDEGWRQDDSGERFVQFALGERWFYVDLPLYTLSKAEARRILSERAGFRYMAQWRQFPKYAEEAARVFNPVNKLYMLGDEEAAAEDAAYVFFDVWRFPADWRFFVTARAFSGGERLAVDAPME